MEYTVQKLAELAGVSGRTLRHYDQIGLLKPKRISSSGYRIYGTTEVDRLQQILFFRELEFPLEEIKRILDSPGFHLETTMRRQRELLVEERKRLDQLVDTIDHTLAAHKGEIRMTDKQKFNGLKKQMLEANEKQYGKELREKYGQETVAASNKKFAGLTEEQYNQLQETAARINKLLAEAMSSGKSPHDPEGMAIAALHKDWLQLTWPAYSEEAHRGLADMYVADERFTKYYDGPAGEGAAQFLRDAIYIYTKQ